MGHILTGGLYSFRAEVRTNTPTSFFRMEIELVPNYTGGDVGDMWYGFSVYFETPD